MVSPQDPYPRKRKAFRDQGEEVAKPVRPGRHDRLWNFARISTQIEQLYAIDPAKGAALFLKAKKAFFKERWTLNHFQSPDSRELLIQLNLLFRGRSKAPPMEPVECGTSLRPLSLDGRHAVPSASHAHQRKSRAKEISWHKDPRIIIIFGVLAFLFVFLVALFLGPVSSTEIIPVQPFQP